MKMVSELRQKARKLVRAPGFTLMTVLTLAVGIGANAAIFSVVNGVLLRPLPYPDEDRVMGLWHEAPGIDIPQLQQAEETYVLYRERNRSFQEIGLGNEFSGSLTGEGEPERVPAARATSSMFTVFQVPPHLGRLFTAEDDEPGGPEIAILSHGLWARRFGSDPGVVGRTIEVNRVEREIVGVMPEGFRDLYGETQLWLPYRIDRESLREVLDDERHTLAKLKAWRNAYFGAVAGLFVFVVLSGSSPAVDMPFLLGAVMVSGAVALYGTLVHLEREPRG